MKDKVYCVKDFFRGRRTTGGAYSATIFYKDKWYDLHNKNEYFIFVKCENHNIEQFVLDNIYFISDKELRKKKLDKINEIHRCK